jgi:hypothetical protein
MHDAVPMRRSRPQHHSYRAFENLARVAARPIVGSSAIPPVLAESARNARDLAASHDTLRFRVMQSADRQWVSRMRSCAGIGFQNETVARTLAKRRD